MLAQANAVDIALIECRVAGFLANQLEVRCNIRLDRSTVTDALSLMDANVGGVLALNEVNLEGENREGPVALNADRVKVASGVFCEGMEAVGEVRLLGAKIGGILFLRNAKLKGVKGVDGAIRTLTADGISIAGGVFCDDMSAAGEIRLHGAKVGGQISMRGASLEGQEVEDGTTTALSADGLEVAHDMICHGINASGDMRLLGAKVGGQLSLRGATLEGKMGRDGTVAAFNAAHIEVGESVYLRNGFRATGEVNLPGAQVAGQISFNEASLTSDTDGGLALNLTGAAVDELVFGFTTIAGTVDLRRASVRSLWDAQFGKFRGQRPTDLWLHGFHYDSLREPLDAKRRLEWIEPSLQGGYFPGVYVELANAFHRVGHSGDARAIAMAGERRAIQQLRRWRPRWLWNQLLWLTTGSGYRNWLAGIWLLGLLVVGSLLFWWEEDTFLALVRIPPDFNPLLYAVDVTVPVLDVGQQRAWAATEWLRWVSLFLTVAGYALVTAVIAAAAGLLNRDQR